MTYREQSISITWTLPILTKLGNFVSEFDCTIDFACWENDRDDWDWEPRAITLDKCQWHERHTITKAADPYMWDVLLRGIAHDEVGIAERLLERVREAA